MLWRTVKSKRSGDKITLEFFEESWTSPKKRLHQVTIDEAVLMRELKRVGLEIPAPAAPEVIEQMKLANEISMYAALTTLAAGPNTVLADPGEQVKEKLWQQLTGKLGLQ